jgi:D-arabinose 1-dehydrogenase-like Zn-dependent alcohol dehydrogenase
MRLSCCGFPTSSIWPARRLCFALHHHLFAVARVGPGQKVGIAGLGGLGHMGIKFSHAFGAHTVLFTTSPSKVMDDKRLGADEVVISKNPDEMAAHANSFDFILDTVAGPHEIGRYLDLLKRDGTLTQVGAPEKPMAVEIFSLIFKRRNFAGSQRREVPLFDRYELVIARGVTPVSALLRGSRWRIPRAALRSIVY